MRNTIFLFGLLLLLTLFIKCNKQENEIVDFDAVGQIIGLDPAQCSCCGNWIIKIEGEQNSRQFLELPDNSGIDLNTATFPLSVSLNWSESGSVCKFIIISKIKVN